MSQVQQSSETEALSPERNDNAKDPVMSTSPDHRLPLQLRSSPHHSPPLELRSSPHHSPPLELRSSPHHSPPLELPSSPHRSPPLQLGSSPHHSGPLQELPYHSPPLQLRGSPHRSPSPHESPSSYQSRSPDYSPTLHQSLSPSPTNSPPLHHQHQTSPPHQIPHENRDANFYASPGPSNNDARDAKFYVSPGPSNHEAGMGSYQDPEPLTSPIPTKVDAYKPRGIRSNRTHTLNVANVSLRAFTAVFTLIAFSLVASDKETLVVNLQDSVVLRFHDLFYLSYLLTANVITFTYVVVTMGIFMYHMTSQKPFQNSQLIAGIFVLDQMLSYLLMSASSSAATGIRAQRRFITGSALDSFESQAYAGVAMSFVAFFLLATVTLISGHFFVNRRRSSF